MPYLWRWPWLSLSLAGNAQPLRNAKGRVSLSIQAVSQGA